MNTRSMLARAVFAGALALAIYLAISLRARRVAWIALGAATVAAIGWPVARPYLLRGSFHARHERMRASRSGRPDEMQRNAKTIMRRL